MKHKCNQYTLELQYNELIIIKSSSHFNLQHWKREIKLNNKQEEKGRHLCLCRWASNGSQARRGFFCMRHLRCLSAELFHRLQQENEWQVAQWVLWFLLWRKKLFLPNKHSEGLFTVKGILSTLLGRAFVSSKPILCDTGELLVWVQHCCLGQEAEHSAPSPAAWNTGCGRAWASELLRDTGATKGDFEAQVPLAFIRKSSERCQLVWEACL